MIGKDLQYPDIRSLSQLLAAQNLLFVLPGEKQIAELYAQSLSEIDGIKSCKLCFATFLLPINAENKACLHCKYRNEQNKENLNIEKFSCQYESLNDYYVFYIETFDKFFGFLILQISNYQKFESYKPFISNLSGFIALSLENRLQKKSLEESRNQLEIKVIERTNELQSLNLYLEEEIETRKKTEEALIDSEEQFRYLFNSMAQGVVIQDSQGAIIDINPSACKILGLTKEQILGENSLDPKYLLIHEDGSPLQPEEIPSNITLKTSQAVHDKIIGVYIPHLNTTNWILTNTIPKFRKESGKLYLTLTTFTNITERKRTEEQIKNINQDLETKIKERTAQLETTNKELEAFAYSVSHDLRAPLRSIGGFSQILIDEYKNQLDDHGKDYLGRINQATQKMGQLIEDLLNLSKVSRSQLYIQTLDISSIAKKIANNLRENQPGRNVNFIIQNEILIKGDINLMHIVVENLLENSWKYTSKHEQATIEFGAFYENNSTICFVRDDGAGFDMQYCQKLFGAFQRLHDSREFSGTGIGLATVQRIIDRHGGKVWAEAEVEKGATFFFTIS